LQHLLPPGAELWLDGGHNPHAAQAIAAWAKDKKLILICGMMARKDTEGFLRPLRDHIEKLYAVPIENEADALPPQDLCRIAQHVGIQARASGTVKDAVIAIADEQNKGAVILICGSLYLAGKILEMR
jgi:dihydrofolate synthase/folylpolyglutamate synthase